MYHVVELVDTFQKFDIGPRTSNNPYKSQPFSGRGSSSPEKENDSSKVVGNKNDRKK